MSERQASLNLVFSSIQNRYNSLFFTKIFQFISHQDQQNCDHVRHYDHECEACDTINCVLATLIKKSQFKGFYSLKRFSQNACVRRRRIKSSIVTPKTKLNSHVQTTANSRFCSAQTNLEISGLTNEVEQSISKLLDRVKVLSDRLMNEKQDEREKKVNKVSSSQKKILISRRLQKLENRLSQFAEEKYYLQNQIPKTYEMSFPLQSERQLRNRIQR